MGKVYKEITPELETWINQQQMFFVATAPLQDDGLINCSPKGLNSFKVLSPTRVAYVDMHGSGIETLSHLTENGRIVFMFASMNGPPKILRLHGQGKAHDLNTSRFHELIGEFPSHQHPRSIIEVNLSRIADSCGYGVPKYEFIEQRNTLTEYATKKGPDQLKAYRSEKNATSLDGLPGIASPSD